MEKWAICRLRRRQTLQKSKYTGKATDDGQKIQNNEQ